jgi:hypothetical protein
MVDDLGDHFRVIAQRLHVELGSAVRPRIFNPAECVSIQAPGRVGVFWSAHSVSASLSFPPQKNSMEAKSEIPLTDELRDKIVPINKRDPIANLKPRYAGAHSRPSAINLNSRDTVSDMMRRSWHNRHAV